MPGGRYSRYGREDIEKYIEMGWWSGDTFGDILDKASNLYPQKEALVDDRIRLTYGQLRKEVDRMAIAMIGLGIRSGDCLLLQLPNWAEWVVSFFSLQKIGAVVVLLLPEHGRREINHFSAMTGAKGWIVPERYRKINYLPIIDDVCKANPGLEHVILVRGEMGHDFPNFEQLLEGADESDTQLAEVARRRPEPVDVAGMVPTGGSTGLPKLALRTHNDYICGTRTKAGTLERSSDDIALICTPVGHNLGLVMTTMTVLTFGRIILLDSTRPEDFCATVQKEAVTFANLVPVLLTRLVNFDGLKEYDLKSLNKIHVGAQHSPPELKKSAYEKIGIPHLISAFGMAEGPACNTRPGDGREIVYSTVGRQCCPDDQYKVIDQGGKGLPPETEGELVAKGPSVFCGYFKWDNRSVFTPDGFFKTGDLAVIDEHGNVKITGRIKDIIIRGGVNISATEVEELIVEHPDVQDVAVVGMPDKEFGERVCAYIQPVFGKTPGFDDIISFLKGKETMGHLLPERVEFIDKLPLTAAGKSDKKTLREEVKKRLEKEKR